jgi:hypothetical protein
MRLLHAAKEGIDAIINEARNSPEGRSSYGQLFDPKTGRPTRQGLAVLKFRDAYVDELKWLNPDYAPALDKWAGHSRIIDQVWQGRNVFSKEISPEDLRGDWEKKNDSEKEFFLAGVADKMDQQIREATLSADEAKKILNTTAAREKFQTMMGKDAYSKFIDTIIEPEREMFDTNFEASRGSQTAGRQIADRGTDGGMADRVVEGMGMMGHVLHGNYSAAIRSAIKQWRDKGIANNPELADAIAKLLIDTDLEPVPNKADTALTVHP